ncbi:MAG: MarR family winged helix-turn-helix transcriptional regulator [Mycobacterium sp.]|nr:MarR family winged helix-turn-helix transcriptional regulator [Mycobacterium sp.]
MTGARTANEARVYHKLQLAAHLVKKAADREMLTETGLSVSQVAVLNAVAAIDGATQRSVAATLGINESAVTAMVRRLVEAGHVTRAQHDGRTRILELTATGTAACRVASRAFRPVNAQFGEALTAGEAQNLADLLEAVIQKFA